MLSSTAIEPVLFQFIRSEKKPNLDKTSRLFRVIHIKNFNFDFINFPFRTLQNPKVSRFSTPKIKAYKQYALIFEVKIVVHFGLKCAERKICKKKQFSTLVNGVAFNTLMNLEYVGTKKVKYFRKIVLNKFMYHRSTTMCTSKVLCFSTICTFSKHFVRTHYSRTLVIIRCTLY